MCSVRGCLPTDGAFRFVASWPAWRGVRAATWRTSSRCAGAATGTTSFGARHSSLTEAACGAVPRCSGIRPARGRCSWMVRRTRRRQPSGAGRHPETEGAATDGKASYRACARVSQGRERRGPLGDGDGLRLRVGPLGRCFGRRHDPRRRLAGHGRARPRRHALGDRRRHGSSHGGGGPSRANSWSRTCRG